MACLFCLLELLVHRLASRVLQRHNEELRQAISRYHEDVGAVMYSNGLLTMQERSQVEEVQRWTGLQKAELLVQAIERRIVAEKSSAPLKKFCEVFQRHHGVGSVVTRMKLQLGE